MSLLEKYNLLKFKLNLIHNSTIVDLNEFMFKDITHRKVYNNLTLFYFCYNEYNSVILPTLYIWGVTKTPINHLIPGPTGAEYKRKLLLYDNDLNPIMIYNPLFIDEYTKTWYISRSI